MAANRSMVLDERQARHMWGKVGQRARQTTGHFEKFAHVFGVLCLKVRSLMNWHRLLSLVRLFVPRKKHKRLSATDSPTPFCQRVSEAKTMARRALAAEHVLLYDYAGKPIPSDSTLWKTADSAWREQAYQALDDLLDRLPPDEFPKAAEELKAA
jgi:hypothetical protein